MVCARTLGELAWKAFPATARGYGQALRWAREHSAEGRRVWAIESTGGDGAGLAASLAATGGFVIEFDHRATRASKDGAKSDFAGPVGAQGSADWPDAGDAGERRHVGRRFSASLIASSKSAS